MKEIGITELREKYKSAKAGYNKYCNVNTSNAREKEYKELAMNFLREHYAKVEDTGNSFSNYLGEDFSCWDENGNKVAVDQKTCVNCEKLQVLVDAWKKVDKYDKEYLVFALDTKVTEAFLFINKSVIALVDFDVVYKKTKEVPKSECFFMAADYYQTTKKAVITLEVKDCIFVKRRKSNN